LHVQVKSIFGMQDNEIIIQEKIAKLIYTIRNAKVMRDSALAEMYGGRQKGSTSR